MPEAAGTAGLEAQAPAQCTSGEGELVLASGESFSCRRQPLQDDSGGMSCCIHILRERAAPDVAAPPAAIADGQGDDARLRRNLEATVDAFAAAIELNDPGNGNHGRRVAALAQAIGKELPLSADQRDGTRLAALIHDLGSFKIPVEVLVKPGKLSAVERLLVQSHPEVAHRILQSIEFPWPIAEIILQHHERIDGTGYPRGLSGSAILIEAKIIAVADAMEAMLSDRPYRPSLGVEAALNELIEYRGTAYDPAVVDACARLVRRAGLRASPSRAGTARGSRLTAPGSAPPPASLRRVEPGPREADRGPPPAPRGLSYSSHSIEAARAGPIAGLACGLRKHRFSAIQK